MARTSRSPAGSELLAALVAHDERMQSSMYLAVGDGVDENAGDGPAGQRLANELARQEASRNDTAKGAAHLTYLDSRGRPVAYPTPTLRITAEFSWGHDVKLCEMGVFAGDASKYAGTGVMLAYAAHPPLKVPANQRLTRTIELSFGGGDRAGLVPGPDLDHWLARESVSSLDGVGTRLAAALGPDFGTIGDLAVAEASSLNSLIPPALAVALPAKASLLLRSVAGPLSAPPALARLRVAEVASTKVEDLASQHGIPIAVADAAHDLCGLLEVCLDHALLAEITYGQLGAGGIGPIPLSGLSVPVLLRPEDSEVVIMESGAARVLGLRWQEVVGATSYRVEDCSRQDGGGQDWSAPPSVHDVRVPPLLLDVAPGRQRRWRVTALSPATGRSSPPSVWRTFTPIEQLEVFAWWTTQAATRELEGLASAFADAHPGVEAKLVGSAPGAKALLWDRLVGGDPPDTFLATVGAELSDHAAAGHVVDLGELYADLGLADVFPEGLVELLTTAGQPCGIPINVRRTNMVWASRLVLDEVGLGPGAEYPSLSEWLDALEEARNAGGVPLAIGDVSTQVCAFEAVLISDLGADGFRGLWSGTTSWSSDAVQVALADYARLVEFMNDDRDALDPIGAIQKVIDGAAAFTIAADEARAQFEDQGLVAGTDYICFPVPGSDGVYGLSAESFAIAAGASDPDAAKAWLDVVGSLAGQSAFAVGTGSTPARVDVDRTGLSECQVVALDALTDGVIVPSLAHGVATSQAVLDAVSRAVGRFTAGESGLEQFTEELASSTETAEARATAEGRATPSLAEG